MRCAEHLYGSESVSTEGNASLLDSALQRRINIGKKKNTPKLFFKAKALYTEYFFPQRERERDDLF